MSDENSKTKIAEIIQFLRQSQKSKSGSARGSYQNDNFYLPHLDKLSAEFASLCADEGLTRLEKSSINALVTYNSYISGVGEDLIRSMAGARFGAEDVLDIQRCQFDEAVQFLVDLNPKQAVN